MPKQSKKDRRQQRRRKREDSKLRKNLLKAMDLMMADKLEGVGRISTEEWQKAQEVEDGA